MPNVRMKPTTADAMQWRAFGSRLLDAETGLEQLGGGVAFPDRPLARPEHADAARPAFSQRGLELLRHHVEGFVPGHRREFAVLVVFAVFLAQKRVRQAVVAVHDLGEEIAFHAVQPAIDFGLHVAVGCDDAPILRCDHHAAAGAAETAGRLVPLQFGEGSVGDEILRRHGRRHPTRHSCHRSGFQFQEFTAVHSILTHMVVSHCRSRCFFAPTSPLVCAVEHQCCRQHVWHHRNPVERRAD